MFALFESPAGYALFKLTDEKKIEKAENIHLDFETPEKANKLLKLKHFEKFNDTTEALASTTASVEGKISKTLKKVLKNFIDKNEQNVLLIGDSKLGSAIKDKFEIQCLSNNAIQELMRCIRSQVESLISGLSKKELTAMSLGLAHSLSRYKLKFSPDKVDTMIVQAVSLLDDIDKDLNNNYMRVKEWYGWHFPELSTIITDNLTYVKAVTVIGTRDNAATSDLSDILPEDIEEKIRQAAEISMGSEIAQDDILNIQNLCEQIVEMANHRDQLNKYLESRMMAMAPNLSVLVGELVGARLISHSGSLINLAKQPASTIQILGAEKALFRALKTKKDTPKYGLIYHTALVGKSSTKNKGKISRMLAAKAALAIRVDALGEDGIVDLGAEHKAKLEYRLRILEEGNIRRISGTGKAQAKFEKYHGVSQVVQYQSAADSTLPSSSKRKFSDAFNTTQEDDEDIKPDMVKKEPTNLDQQVEETPKQKKKKRKENLEEMQAEESPKKKVKQEKVEESNENQTDETPKEKKKKKKKQETDVETQPEEPETTGESKKKKKKQVTDTSLIEENSDAITKKKKKKQVEKDD
ncbi:nucleolar protein 58 [Coccinella septempunctata]|uniref:nucleolar protein 58 n=1 Tax=Coccinella septempunctata TaxID=41139 RepID=UPI001D060E9F|nr:nucleolar protein 58 [Coccinella septempunctata]